ncbi:MAG: SPASM domain-containing protein [Crocinitomicaceae bacterium]|nr:SPASM domain-containing protein [Crocinitomicaceae bacterium]
MLSFLFKKTSACEAPIRSLRFNHSGNVLACCFNRGYVFGKFPEQSINEIWFGDKKNKLTKALFKNDFSLGCLNCEYYVKDNRKSSGAFQYDYLKEQKQYKNYPTMFDFELGSSCNFECIMCSGEYSSAIRKNRENKKPYYSPYEEFSGQFIEQLVPFIPHLTEMRFLGGEPFLMNIYYKI